MTEKDQVTKAHTPGRPEFCTDEMLDYLDELRESGAVNMFGAGRWLEVEFPELTEGTRSFRSSDLARDVLLYWMQTFPRGRS